MEEHRGRPETLRPRVFISHSTQDKKFVDRLAKVLKTFSLNVWYADWEIGVGDSIVDKVFEGLDESGALVIVLSQASVASRWVREELTVAVMRRLSEQNIRILPVLIEDCEIPTSLKHVKYADFRMGDDIGLSSLIEAIAPGAGLKQSLEEYYRQLCELCDTLTEIEPSDDVRTHALRMHALLESALGMRVELLFRQSPSMVRNTTLFEKIEVLGDHGIDVRSEAWMGLVAFRNHEAHRASSRLATVATLARVMRREGAEIGDHSVADAITSAMAELKKTMYRICFEASG